MTGLRLVAITPANGGKPTNRYTNYAGFAPTGTVSATKVMMGIGSTVVLTPATTRNVRVTITGQSSNNTLGTFSTFNAYFGTGTAPINGAAVTGTAVQTRDGVVSNIAAFNSFPFIIIAEISSLTNGTAYWFDMGLSSSSGAATSSLVINTIIVEEF